MKKAIDWLQKIQIAVGGFFLCVFLLTVVYQMFSRYLGIAATWTEDVSMYSFIWAVFMGAGAMVYEKRHFAFTSISDMMKNDKIKSIKMCIRDSEKSTLFRKCVAFCLLGSIPNPLIFLSLPTTPSLSLIHI